MSDVSDRTPSSTPTEDDRFGGEGLGPVVLGAEPPEDRLPSVSPNAAVLAGLAAPDVDLAQGRHLVEVRARRRMRRRRSVLGVAAAVVVFGVAVAVWPRPEPQEIDADGDRATTTSTTASSTTSVAPTLTTVPATVVTSSSTTSTTAAVTTVPTTIVTTTTVARNQPMTVQAELLDMATMAPATNPAAGSAVLLRVRWSDPDLADPATVDVHAEFGDPLVTYPVSGVPRPSCDRSGGGSSAQVDVPFRYSTAGTPTIQVEVTACDGSGAYGERVTRSVPVRVAAPPTGSRIAVLAGVEGGRAPDAGEVIAGTTVTAKRTPELALVLKADGTPATVAAVPAAYTGGLQLRWQPTVCQPSADPASIEAATPTVRVRLGPTTTTCSTAVAAPAQALGTGSATRP